MLRDMFKKTYTVIDSRVKTGKREKTEEPSIPQGLWRKCNKCGQPIYVEDVKNNDYVCPKCGGYFRVHAYRRIEMLIDEGTFEEWDKEMEFSNPLEFPGYEKKVAAAREKTGLDEAVYDVLVHNKNTVGDPLQIASGKRPQGTNRQAKWVGHWEQKGCYIRE